MAKKSKQVTKSTEELSYIPDELQEKDSPVIVKRTKTSILIEISLSPEQIKQMELALEELCNKFLNM